MTTATTNHPRAAGHPISAMTKPSYLPPEPFAEQRSERSQDLVYVSAALATMGSCPTWDARMTCYLSCRALMTANHDFGAFAQAYSTIKTLDCDVSEAEHAHTLQFEQPFWQAAVQLAMTPAPTFRAALFKVELIREDNLGVDLTIARPPMTIIAEDFARLAGMADDPVSRYYRALDSFSASSIGEADYTAAIDALDEWAPTTSTDLLRKFLAVFSDGSSPREVRVERLMEQAGAVFDLTTAQRRPAR